MVNMTSDWKAFISIISVLSAVGPARSVPGHMSLWWGWEAAGGRARPEKHHAAGQRRTHDLRHMGGQRPWMSWKEHPTLQSSEKATADNPVQLACSSAMCSRPLLDGSLSSPAQPAPEDHLAPAPHQKTEPLPLSTWISRRDRLRLVSHGLTGQEPTDAAEISAQSASRTGGGNPAPSRPNDSDPSLDAAGSADELLDQSDTERFVPSVVSRLALLAAHVRMPAPSAPGADGSIGGDGAGDDLPLPWLRQEDRRVSSEQEPAPAPVPLRVRRGGAEAVCERERFGAACAEPFDPPSVQDSNVVMVGGANSATITALRRCGRQLRYKVRELAGIPAVLYRFRDHSALYQLLVYISSDDGAAAGRQLQRTLRAMADLFGGYSLVYLPEPVPSELTALAYEFCQHRAGPCRWTDDLGPVLTATRRLTRNSLLLNAYDAEGGLCGGPCGGAGGAAGQEQVAGRPMSEQLERLTQLWCSGRWHTVVEIVLPSERPSLTPTKPQAKSSNSLAISDILPGNMKLYDKNRPPKYRGEPTTVYFHVTVITLDSINEESMTYVADVFLAQSWRDHRLRLPENMTEEYRILDVNWLLNIWRPDCIFKNAKKVTFHEMSVPNHYLWLYKDKTLLYMSK